jgi:hypothetical protein
MSGDEIRRGEVIRRGEMVRRNGRCDGLPADIERKLVAGARQSDRAMVVGNRAGVIEWANDAWTRVTGYALDESVGKPVGSFLSGVDVDPGIVEFVAACFRRGLACEVDLPLDPPRREPLRILLRVEPLFDSMAEPSDFLAIATDLGDRARADVELPLREIDLAELATRVARAEQWRLGDMVAFDAILPADLPPILADEPLLERLMVHLIARGVENVGDGWGTITFSAGVLGADCVPILHRAFQPPLPAGHWAWLEIHDTGCFASGAPYTKATEPFLSTAFPDDAIRFTTAEARIRRHGGEIRVDSCPIDGNSVILLFPFSSGDSPAFD